MKTALYYTIVFAACAAAFVSCKKMDSKYEKFIVPGGIIYPAMVKSPVIHSGRYKVQISWLKSNDPSVVKAKIFWDNYSDSLEVPVSAGSDTINTTINDLEERAYVFNIKSYDAKGNSSVPAELICNVYGDKYQQGLLSRPVVSSVLDDNGEVTINWGGANISGGAYATDVKYTDNADQVKQLRFLASDATSAVPDIKPGTSFQYRTVYLPDTSSIDTFYTSFQENSQYFFDKKAWTVVAFSSQHDATAANIVTNIIDGSAGTRWHTFAGAPSSQYPHYVTIDMKTEKIITAFEIFRMTGDDRACNRFQLLVSNDNATWTDLGMFNFNRLTDEGQLYPIPSRPHARYFKFVGISGPQPYMVTGEINVYGL